MEGDVEKRSSDTSILKFIEGLRHEIGRDPSCDLIHQKNRLLEEWRRNWIDKLVGVAIWINCRLRRLWCRTGFNDIFTFYFSLDFEFQTRTFRYSNLQTSSLHVQAIQNKLTILPSKNSTRKVLITSKADKTFLPFAIVMLNFLVSLRQCQNVFNRIDSR